MVLETPLLKVSRPSAACSRCRSAKIKCDGKLPACSACEKNGKALECASANDEFAKGKERSYVATLETRVEKLEKILKELQLRNISPASDVHTNISTQIHGGEEHKRADEEDVHKSTVMTKRKEAQDIDELVSDFGYLTVNATARDYFGFTSFMSYARLILFASCKNRLRSKFIPPLPSRHTTLTTVQHYLDHVYPLLPFFKESSLYSSVDSVYQSQLSKRHMASAGDHWNVRMVLAISSASLSEQQGDQHYLDGVGHVNAALEYAEIVLRPGSISNIQSLLFLAQYASYDPFHFDSWNLIGAASRAMIDLGLHQDPSSSTMTTKTKLELRRRVFYNVFLLDRSSAMVQSRVYSFSDDSTNVAIPKYSRGAASPHSRTWLKGSNSSIDYIAVRKIQSRWYYDMFISGRELWLEPYSYIWQTYHTMTAWHKNIAPIDGSDSKVLLELELLYSYIHILGPSPRNPSPDSYALTLLCEHCISYVALLHAAIGILSQRVSLTFDDYMRTHMIGKRLLEFTATHTDQLSLNVLPDTQFVNGGNVDIPRLPSHYSSPEDKIINRLTAIKQLSEILNSFGRRWGNMTLRDDFDHSAQPTLIALNSHLWNIQQQQQSGILSPSSNNTLQIEQFFLHQQQQQQQSRKLSSPQISLLHQANQNNNSPPLQSLHPLRTLTKSTLSLSPPEHFINRENQNSLSSASSNGINTTGGLVSEYIQSTYPSPQSASTVQHVNNPTNNNNTFLNQSQQRFSSPPIPPASFSPTNTTAGLV